MREQAVVLDVDGVILDSFKVFEELFKRKLKGDEKWEYFRENCNGSNVTFIKNSLKFIQVLNKEIKIILLTARNEKCREATEARLRAEKFIYHELYMRPENNYEESHVLKNKILFELMSIYDIVAFIDDDLSNCEAAKDLGILALRKV